MIFAGYVIWFTVYTRNAEYPDVYECFSTGYASPIIIMSDSLTFWSCVQVVYWSFIVHVILQ